MNDAAAEVHIVLYIFGSMFQLYSRLMVTHQTEWHKTVNEVQLTVQTDASVLVILTKNLKLKISRIKHKKRVFVKGFPGLEEFRNRYYNYYR